jgi:hypothetical protein
MLQSSVGNLLETLVSPPLRILQALNCVAQALDRVAQAHILAKQVVYLLVQLGESAFLAVPGLVGHTLGREGARRDRRPLEGGPKLARRGTILLCRASKSPWGVSSVGLLEYSLIPVHQVIAKVK